MVRSELLLRASVGFLLALSLVAVLEGGARLLRPPRAAAHTGLEWMEPSAELGWRNRPGFRGTVFSTERAFDEQGLFTLDSPAAAAASRQEKRLILLLGDSRTFGNGVPAGETYGEILDRRLPDSEVINLAVAGHTVFQGRAALEIYVPRFRPDVVVFAYGFNDRRYVLHPEEVDSKDRFRRLARQSRLDRLAGSLALVSLLRGRAAVEPEGIEERPLDLATVLPRVPPEDFRRNLEAAARYCAERGVRLIFLLLNDHPVESRHLARGVRKLRKGQLAQAERSLRTAVSLNNKFSDTARLYLADLYTRTGRGREAAAVRISPRTLRSVTGGYPIVFDGDYREITLRVAMRHEVPIVDAGSAIDRHPEWYFDFCHFGGEGHRTVADLLAAELARAGVR
jgi:lysophospholipase L1-like esterase